MASTDTIQYAIQFSLVVPHGEWYRGRDNFRVWCAHGEIIWSAGLPDAPEGPVDQWEANARAAYHAKLRAWRKAHRAEACGRLREKTGCTCQQGER